MRPVNRTRLESPSKTLLVLFTTSLAALPGGLVGQTLVRDLVPGSGSSDPKDLVVYRGKLFFSALNHLWVSDGTAAGTTVLLGSSSPNGFLEAGGKLFFNAQNAANGWELYVTDGTAAGTRMVVDLNPGPDRGVLLTVGANVTRVAFGDRIVFSGDDGGAQYGQELYVSDGTAGGTGIFADFVPGPLGSGPDNNAVHAGKVYSRAFSSSTGYELMASDGTPAGTGLVLDINHGPNPSAPDYLTSFGNILVFTADDGVVGAALWRSDGTAAGTTLVKDINPNRGPLGGPMLLTVFGSGVVFEAIDGSGAEPWITDGTPAGTTLLKDVRPGPNGSTASGFVVAGTTLFFQAGDGVNGNEVWKSDGTSAGTVLVKDVNPGAANGLLTDSIRALGSGTRVVFFGNSGTTGWEVWTSDGTATGTSLVAEINPGSGNGVIGANFGLPFPYVPELGLGFVTGFTPATGMELYSFTAAQLGGAAAYAFGSSCQLAGAPRSGLRGAPFAGNGACQLTLAGASANAAALLLLAIRRNDLPLGPCVVYPDLAVTTFFAVSTDPLGAAALPLPIPNDMSLWGQRAWSQWLIVTAGGPLLGLADLSDGLGILIGRS